MSEAKLISYDGEFLRCPSCGGTYLHQQQAVMHERRNGEDGDALEVCIDGPRVEARIVGKKATVGRRNAIRISFSCENCPAVLTLYIVQHKGQTLISWGRPVA